MRIVWNNAVEPNTGNCQIRCSLLQINALFSTNYRNILHVSQLPAIRISNQIPESGHLTFPVSTDGTQIHVRTQVSRREDGKSRTVSRQSVYNIYVTLPWSWHLDARVQISAVYVGLFRKLFVIQMTWRSGRCMAVGRRRRRRSRRHHHHHHYHHHLALQPFMNLGLLCYSPPQVSILGSPSPSFNAHRP